MMMRAYKVFNRDLTCRGFRFEEGETYEMDEAPVLCETGFHFCKELVLGLWYYPVTDTITENKYAEVEVLGDVVLEQPTQHKGCTNKIKIVRVLTDEEVLGLISDKLNSGYHNTGNYNAGHYNLGYYNSGNYNSGSSNSGDYNLGNRNSGSYNLGDCNSGNCNLGHYNSGDYNLGNYNLGDYNLGDSNAGSWNSGTYNIRFFNRPCSIIEWTKAYKPMFLRFALDPSLSYKENFIKSYNEADPKDRKLVKKLPNFDADIFYEITGIDLRERERKIEEF